MKSILITGCNRGIGLGLVKQFLRQNSPPERIFATVRDQSRAEELQDLAKAHSSLKILQTDVTDFESFPSLCSQLENALGGAGLNLLINNAGFSPKSSRLNYVRPEDMAKTFLINVTAPVMLTKALKPLLQKGATPEQPSWIVNMSSVLGSIAQNKDGGLFPYRASKSALNQCTKSMSIDLFQQNIHAIALHPGWVKTDMGGQNADLEVEDACSNMVRVIGQLTRDKNGTFIQHDGSALPW